VLNDAALLLRNSSEVLEGHMIDVNLPPTEVAFEADENQIRQIIWNLATNGLRAMRSGGRLTLGARIDPGADETGDAVVLDVSDEGVGIPPEELDAIFQPFRGTFSKGTGLGLAIVHRIVSDYGGEIQVRSTPGKGTTVSVRLPVRAVAAAT
jgi:signal transduction histidine kinase